MKEFTISAISLTLVIAVVLVAGVLVTPYHYAMAGKNQDASKSNTHNGVRSGDGDNANDGNGGNGGNGGNRASGNGAAGGHGGTHPPCHPCSVPGGLGGIL